MASNGDEESVTTIAELDFIQTTPTTSGDNVASINSSDFVEMAADGSAFGSAGKAASSAAPSGLVSSLGVAWLLEEDDNDDDIQGTLLYVVSNSIEYLPSTLD
jgi:hypothetical protein